MTISTLETVLKQMPAMDTQDVIAAAHLILKAQAVASKESVELHAVYCYNTCSHYRPGHSQLGSVWIGSAHTNPLRPCYTNPCQIVGPCYKLNFQNDCNQHLQMWTKASNLPHSCSLQNLRNTRQRALTAVQPFSSSATPHFADTKRYHNSAPLVTYVWL